MTIDRFNTLLYTVQDVARYVGVSVTTLARWTQSSASGAPMITALPQRAAGWPSILFIGLAEGVLLSLLRRRGAGLRRIRRARAQWESRFAHIPWAAGGCMKNLPSPRSCGSGNTTPRAMSV